MEKQANKSIVKFMTHSTIKAKLKATAALNNMTIGELCISAVFEKYPYLKNDTRSSDFNEEKEETNSQVH